MQLNITTDYAIRIVLYLGMTERITTSAEIAKEMSVPANYVPNIVKKLRDSKFIHTMFGPQGGYRLAKDPKDISLLDIIRTMEGNFCVNRCLETDYYCDNAGLGNCAIHEVYKEVQEQLEKTLRSRRFVDLIKETKLAGVSV